MVLTLSEPAVVVGPGGLTSTEEQRLDVSEASGGAVGRGLIIFRK